MFLCVIIICKLMLSLNMLELKTTNNVSKMISSEKKPSLNVYRSDILILVIFPCLPGEGEENT